MPQGVFQGAIGFAQDQVINATGKTRQAGAGEPVMEYTYLVTVPKHLNAQGLMVPAASHTVTTSSKIPDKLRPQGDKKGKTESWKLTGSVQKGTSSGGELVSDAPSFPNLVAQVAATLRTRGVNASVSRGLAWDLVSQYYNQLVPYDNPAYGTGTNMQGMVGPDSYPQQPYGNLFSW